MAGPGAYEKDARLPGQPRYDRLRQRVREQTLGCGGLRLNGLLEKRAGRLQAASSQAFRNW